MRASSGLSLGGRYVCPTCRARLSVRGSNIPLVVTRSIHESTLAKRAEAERLWQIKAEAQKRGDEPTMLQILEERGYINQIAGDRDKTEALMRDERLGVYVGIDPTASSMHVGHLVPFMALFWMYAQGYRTFTLLGGATAAVGDPTGRKTSRDLNGLDRKHNITTMHLQLKTIWANVHHHLTQRRAVAFDVGSQRGLVNNSAWLTKLSITEFLRMLGRNVRVGTMLGRETARFKMEKGDGLSFAEFTYPLLQGWDWWQLYKERQVKMQIGGSDQLGNIVAGKEAFTEIAKEDMFERGLDSIEGATPVGFTTPLLTTASGAKFGKSEGNAIWLDPELTSVFDQYQFFVRTADADLERYLKLFTFLSLEEITTIMEENAKDPGKRLAGKRLAEEVCLALHGENLTNKAKAEHAALFGGGAEVSKWKDVNHVEWEMRNKVWQPLMINPQLNKYAPGTSAQSGFEHRVVLPEHRVKDSTFPALLTWTSMVASRSEGNRMIQQSGAYVGHRAKDHIDSEICYVKIPSGLSRKKTWDYVLGGKMLVLRIGKWKTKIVQVVTDQEWWDAIKAAEEAESRDALQKPTQNHDVSTGSLVGDRRGMVSQNITDKVGEDKTPVFAQGSQWLALQRRMEADDERWEKENGDLRRNKEEEKRLRKYLRQQLTLDEHARALNPQRKHGRRAIDPTEGATATMVHDWDKSLTRP